MKTFYRVVSTFYDNGRTHAFVETVRASQKPENTFTNGPRCDIYEDYFTSEEEARKYAEGTKNA